MAFALVNIDNPEIDYEKFLDVQILHLSFIEEDDFVADLKISETHPCSDAELGLDGSSTSKFYSDIK